MAVEAVVVVIFVICGILLCIGTFWCRTRLIACLCQSSSSNAALLPADTINSNQSSGNSAVVAQTYATHSN
jgi:hypothetical protein